MRFQMAVNIIGALVALMTVFGIIVSIIGYVSFTDAFKKEYATSTYHMADTATALVNGDNLAVYLEGEEEEEYLLTKQHIDTYCEKMSVSLIYVIMVDTSDYGRFVSVFNAVDNTVDNSSYIPWELGHKRDTTNDEYRQKYKAIYQKESVYETVYRINLKDGHHPHITTLVPVKNSEGDVVAVLCLERPMSELKNARQPYLIKIAVSTFILALLAAVSAAFYIHKQFVSPIKSVSEEATRFARESTKGVPLGQLSRIEEISGLAASIDKMEADMEEYMAHLTTLTAEKERISTELGLATRIQADMLPSVFPPFPDRSEFDIFASMTPAKEVGGDFYDFFLIDENHLGIVMADVSGKGVPAALFMMASMILIHTEAMRGGSPAEVLTAVNDMICKNNREEMFVTVWFGILAIDSGVLTAANAGHEYPAIKSPDGPFELYKDKHGFVIGGMSGLKYKQYEIKLLPGSKLFLYTDGVPEATNADHALFGTQRMIDALNSDRDGSPQAVLQAVNGAVSDFIQDSPQFDDLTMLCLLYRGNAINRKQAEIEITLPAAVDSIAQATQSVDHLLETVNCPIKAQTQINVAIDEILSNIAYYAYGSESGSMTIRAEASQNPNGIILTFIDGGMPYNPLEKDDPDVRLSADERKIGGLGIYIVKKTMDDVSYQYKNGQNILTVSKYF